MKMMYAKRLIKLVNFLSEIPSKKFYYGNFAKETKTCGTVCCALGWAGMMPEFRKLGLRTYAPNNEVTLEGVNSTECRIAEIFFDLTADESFGLFIPGFQKDIGFKNLTDKAKLKTVMNNIVAVVERYHDVKLSHDEYEVVSRKVK